MEGIGEEQAGVAIAPPAGSMTSGGLPGATELELTERIVAPTNGGAGRWTYAALLGSHAFIDIFPIFFTSLMLVFDEQFKLDRWQVTVIYMITPIFSGALQPFFAWLTDRFDTRLCGPVGLLIGTACCCSIGFAQTFWQLIALQIVGVIGTGMYHPIMTAVAGRLGGRFVSGGRALAIGIFIAAGMAGQAIGPIVSTRVNRAWGTEELAWFIAPGLLVAIVLHLAVGRVKHRRDGHAEHHASMSAEERLARWRLVIGLTVQNALRFTANSGLFIMFNEWAGRKIVLSPALLAMDSAGVERARHAAASESALVSGMVSSAMVVGMGIAVVWGGRIARPGREKSPLIWMSIFGAVFVALTGFAGDWMVPVPRELMASESGAYVVAHPITWVHLIPMSLCASISSIGFFGTFPISASLAQRLLPAHTGQASALMMGVGWAIAAISAPIAAVIVHGSVFSNGSDVLLPEWRINLGFIVFGSLMVLAGLLSAWMPDRLIHAVRDEA